MNFIIATAINLFSQILVIIVIIDVVLSYIMNPYHPIRMFLDRLIEPLLAPIRRIVPTLGMMDFSPLILILLIQLLSNLLIKLLVP